MKLLSNCVGCKNSIQLKSSAKTRPDLEYEKGETFSVYCPGCHRKQSKTPNDVIAVVSHTPALFGVGISLIVTAALWYIMGAIGTISLAIPFIISANESRDVANFNKYKL